MNNNPNETDLSTAIAGVVETDFLECILDALQPGSGEDRGAALMALSLVAALIRLRCHIERCEDNWLGSGYEIHELTDIEVIHFALADWQAECLRDGDEYDCD